MEQRVKRDEAKVKKDKELYDNLLLSVVSRENAVEDRENRIQGEINAAASRMIADAKEKNKLEYLLATKRIQAEADEKYESWHKLHDLKYYGMLMFLLVFGVVHGFVYNEKYPEYLETVLNIILNIFKGIGKGIWTVASFVGQLGGLISNDIAGTIVRWILIIAVIGLIAVIICRFILYGLFGRIIEYWIEIKLWDSATFQIAVILIGISTLIPAPFNLVGVCLLAFIGYILIRSFVCINDYELKVNIIKTVVTVLVIVSTVIGLIFYIGWMLSQTFK